MIQSQISGSYVQPLTALFLPHPTNDENFYAMPKVGYQFQLVISSALFSRQVRAFILSAYMIANHTGSIQKGEFLPLAVWLVVLEMPKPRCMLLSVTVYIKGCNTSSLVLQREYKLQFHQTILCPVLLCYISSISASDFLIF